MKKLIYVLIFGAVAVSGGCKRSSEGIQLKGSDTMVNANQKVAEEFRKTNPQVLVSIGGGGSGVGIAALMNSSCDIAAASRDMKPQEIQQARSRGVEPKETIVAYDGVAFIVNNKNPVSKLTIAQLHDIFTGKITNWKDVGGSDMEISTISREVSSGTHEYVKEEVIQLGKKDSKDEFRPKTLLLSSSQAIVEEVVTNEGAIGYLGMGYVSGRTKSIEVSRDGLNYFTPTVETVMSRKYPLSRPLYYYTNGEPKGTVKQFVDFALSPAGQEQFKVTGFVPLALESHVEKTR
jgi:phosphate transport system substrate-binding protein